MKKIIFILLAVLILLLLTACPEPVVDCQAEVFDANDTCLGHLAAAGDSIVTIINDAGYLFHLKWNGEFSFSLMMFEMAIAFTGPDATGTAYLAADMDYSSSPISNNLVIPADINGGTYYLAANPSSAGVPEIETEPVDIISAYDFFSGTVAENIVTLDPANNTLIELVAMDLSELGIPETITGPISIRFAEE